MKHISGDRKQITRTNSLKNKKFGRAKRSGNHKETTSQYCTLHSLVYTPLPCVVLLRATSHGSMSTVQEAFTNIAHPFYGEEPPDIHQEDAAEQTQVSVSDIKELINECVNESTLRLRYAKLSHPLG